MRGADGSFSSSARGQTGLLAPAQLIKGLNARLILLASDGVGIVVSFQSSISLRAVLLDRILELLDLLLESFYALFALVVLLGTRPLFLQGRPQRAHVPSRVEHLSQ